MSKQQPVEAKYRVSLLIDEALRSLRQLKQGMADISAPAGVADGLSKGVAQAEAVAQQTARKRKDIARETTAQVSAEAAAQADAEKKARRDALEAERAAAAERKRIAREERERQRAEQRADRDAKRAADKQAARDANQQRMLAPQVTDIAVGLATGQNPFYVLLQQGGQLKDMFGGVGNAARTLGSVFTPLRVLIGGVASAIGVLAYATLQGHKESDALNKAMALTGNIAQTNAAAIEASSRRIGAAQSVSIASAREALTAAVETGRFIGPTVDTAARAAVALSRLTGESAADAVKDFAAMSDGVSDWAAKQNRAYNFLNIEEYKRIRSLEAAGQAQEAMRLVLDRLAQTMEQRSVPAIGIFERAWNGVRKAVSDTLEDIRSIGRDTTIDDKIRQLQGEIERNGMLNWRNGRRPAQVRAREEELRAQLAPLLVQREQERAVEAARAAHAKKVQDDIKTQSKEFQDALAQVEQSGQKKALAQLTASLDARQSAIEAANARGLLSAADYAKAFGAVEAQRAQAEAQQLRSQIARERARDPKQGEERMARDALVNELEAQLIQHQSRARQLAAQTSATIAGQMLEDARAAAERWADAWRQADSQVRAFAAQNSEFAASRLLDPIGRAEAEAKARVAAARQQLDQQLRELQRESSLLAGRSQQSTNEATSAKDPAERSRLESRALQLTQQRVELERQINALRREGSAALQNDSDAAKFNSLRTQWGEITDRVRLKEQQLDDQVQRGKLNTEEAEQRKFEVRDRALVQLRTILEALRALRTTEADQNVVESAETAIEGLEDRTTDLQRTMRDAGRSGFSQMLTDIATKSKSAGEAIRDMLGGIARSFLDVISRRLGEQLFESLFGKGQGGSSNGAAPLVQAGANWLASLFQFHEGGIVGQGGTPRTIGLGPVFGSMMGSLPRYHSGGIVGLRSNEQLAVLEHGEEVLTEGNPRHSRNFSGGGPSIGNLSLSVKVEGAQGEQAQLETAGGQLAQMMMSTIERWAADQSREGGILAKGSR